MPKMKVESLPEEKKDFFYEIIGTLFILVGLIIIGRFGSVGNFLNTILHILLGDYVFVLILLLIIIGFRGIIKKKLVNITSINFIGFWMVYIGLSLFCCFSLFNGLEANNSNYFSKSFGLYRRYLSNYSSSYTCGGGIIVGLIFQGLILFFGNVGIYLFTLVLSGMGLFFLSGLTFFNIFKRRRGLFKYVKGFLLKVICYFKKIEIPKKSKDEVKVQTSMLSDGPKSTNLTIQEEYNHEVIDNLNLFLRNKGIRISATTYYTSYVSSRIVLDLQANSYLDDIKQFFMNKCFFLEDEGQLNIELLNKFKAILSLKTLLSKGLKFTYPLGIELNDEVKGWNYEEFHLHIVGDYKTEVDEFLKSLIIMIHLQNKQKTSINFICDEKVFLELKAVYTVNYLAVNDEIDRKLEDIIEEYEKREELLRYLNVENFKDVKYNKNVVGMDEIYIIVRTKISLLNKTSVDKINFLLKNSARFGIYLIIVMNYPSDLALIERQNQPTMIFKTMDILLSLKVLNNDNACYLCKNSECLFLENKKINHLALGYVTDFDYENILKKFTG